MDIKKNIIAFETELKDSKGRLIAVSKTKPIDMIQEAYDYGLRDFGENKIQELVEKQEKLPKDIRWHMIGHLQRNKVKYIAPFIHLIHSVDSLRLLQEINKQGERNNRKIACLLQVHIAEEENKFGFDESELWDMIKGPEFQAMAYISIKGLMGMATFTENQAIIRKEFAYLRAIYEKILTEVNLPQLDMSEISMGMSGDYKIALEEGSTMVRIGSAIFGHRNY
jgi:pyridoxal phosphate enzyme (YggS family)